MAAAWVADTGTVADIWAGYAVIIMGGRIAATVAIDRQKWAATLAVGAPAPPAFWRSGHACHLAIDVSRPSNLRFDSCKMAGLLARLDAFRLGQQASLPIPLHQSKNIVCGLAALFGMDSFDSGFLVQSLLALWLFQRFQISVPTVAAILFWSGIFSAVSYLLAVPIAARIGLIRTMVFTHLPSNIFLMLVPFSPDLATAIGLLLARSALSQMDVPTRASYVMAVVTPEERPAAASITAVPKVFAWAAGSMISGYLLTLSTFG